MPEIESPIQAVREAYDQRAWHGPNLKKLSAWLSIEEVSWRPQPKRHNV